MPTAAAVPQSSQQQIRRRQQYNQPARPVVLAKSHAASTHNKRFQPCPPPTLGLPSSQAQPDVHYSSLHSAVVIFFPQ